MELIRQFYLIFLITQFNSPDVSDQFNMVTLSTYCEIDNVQVCDYYLQVGLLCL